MNFSSILFLHNLLRSNHTCAQAAAGYPEELAQMDNIVPYQYQEHAMMDEGDFAEDPSSIVQGFTVLLDAVQLAFYMGYDRVSSATERACS
ncbi:MAG: hypothetical protein LBF51_06100 [Zoogloeaceae bacterium]|jgi:hypothetical protein|nr:hypothetical protein [Zoogloeaceae bacterium]